MNENSANSDKMLLEEDLGFFCKDSMPAALRFA